MPLTQQRFEPVGRFSSELRMFPKGLTIPAAEAAGRLVVVRSFFDFERHDDDMYKGVSDLDNEGATTIVIIEKVDPNRFVGMSQIVDDGSRLDPLCRVQFLSDPECTILFGSVSRTIKRDDIFATWILRRQSEA